MMVGWFGSVDCPLFRVVRCLYFFCQRVIRYTKVAWEKYAKGLKAPEATIFLHDTLSLADGPTDRQRNTDTEGQKDRQTYCLIARRAVQLFEGSAKCCHCCSCYCKLDFQSQNEPYDSGY